MNILVCGAGAIGQLYGGYLALAGHQVGLLNSTGLMRSQAFQLEQLDGSQQRWQCTQLTTPADVILVTTKAYQVIPAVKQLLQQRRLNSPCILVLLHNGMGPAEQILPLLPAHCQLILASSRHGALRTAANNVKHTGIGQTDMGAAATNDDHLKALTQLFSSMPGDTFWHQNIWQPLWQKLLINAVINPLTARDQVANGNLLAPHYAAEISQLCSEGAAVARAAGITMQDDQLVEQVRQVAQATAANRSSMLQDVLHQRPTEIDYISGYLVQQAQTFKLPSAGHQALLTQIHQLAPSNG
ncbi:2-dehydropantoate 2-reductase [Neiella marina]|uniref:2-dehydropantoate 2-reductase n=1 Tax=Neiella holothuriorum TaxID=2870530 RepID=A0ABS7EIT5_9GAMM|nr:2-dehydropantoate 2-reductase [Neiella holothuriorum]MBW8191798.1 2-dehydropantoate 2-reductase [Neiella holothuriorum]